MVPYSVFPVPCKVSGVLPVHGEGKDTGGYQSIMAPRITLTQARLAPEPMFFAVLIVLRKALSTLLVCQYVRLVCEHGREKPST